MMAVNSSNYPPCCFCFKPAVTLTTGIGIVYECHYTEQNLWLDPLADNPTKNVENNIDNNNSNNNINNSTNNNINNNVNNNINSINSQTHSKSIPSPLLSNINPKARESIQNIASTLEIMTRATKAISPTTWGSPSRDPPSSPTPPTPSIETTKVVINHLNPQPIARPKTTISKTTSQKLAPPPANSQQKIVCGFHMHMELWELFKTHGRSLEQERREKKQRGRERNGYRHQEVPSKKKEITPIKQDIMLARWHHEIVLNHRSLHSELRSLVLKSSCKPYHHTFGRWINWGEEVIGGKTSPAGGAPHCACGLPMKLSWFNRNQESSVVFFCELRLADTKTGCSRAVNSGKWVQWQELDPVHALNTKNQLIETPAAYTLIGSDEEYSSCSDEDEDEDEDKDEDVNDSAFIETEDETSLPETDFRIADSGESERVGWDEHIITSIPAVNLKKLQFSSGFLDDDANGEGLGHVREPSPYELSDNEDPWQTYNPRKLQNNNRGDYWGNQSGGVGLDLEMKMRALAEKVDNVHNRLAPNQAIENEGIAECEKSLSVLLESCGRMKDYTMGSYADGLNNPTLKCRVCKEGTLLSVNTPCFHLVMCDQCIQEYRQCIICKSAIQSSQRVFW